MSIKFFWPSKLVALFIPFFLSLGTYAGSNIEGQITGSGLFQFRPKIEVYTRFPKKGAIPHASTSADLQGFFNLKDCQPGRIWLVVKWKGKKASIGKHNGTLIKSHNPTILFYNLENDKTLHPSISFEQSGRRINLEIGSNEEPSEYYDVEVIGPDGSYVYTSNSKAKVFKELVDIFYDFGNYKLVVKRKGYKKLEQFFSISPGKGPVEVKAKLNRDSFRIRVKVDKPAQYDGPEPLLWARNLGTRGDWIILNEGESGVYTTPELKAGSYRLTMSHYDLKPKEVVITLGNQSPEYTEITYPWVAKKKTTGKGGKISGVLRDARNRKKRLGRVLVRVKTSPHEEQSLQLITTDYDGSFHTQKLPLRKEGYYLEFERPGFLKSSRRHLQVSAEREVILGQSLANDQAGESGSSDLWIWKIVLNWTGEVYGLRAIQDVDSYLKIPYERDVLYYGYQKNDTKFKAALDTDQRNWMGPETFSIYKNNLMLTPAEPYRYWVRAYGTDDSEGLGNSMIHIEIHNALAGGVIRSYDLYRDKVLVVNERTYGGMPVGKYVKENGKEKFKFSSEKWVPIEGAQTGLAFEFFRFHPRYILDRSTNPPKKVFDRNFEIVDILKYLP